MNNVTVQITNTPLVIRNGSNVRAQITNTPVTVRIGDSPITLRFPASVPGPAGDVAAFLAALGTFNSNADAGAGIDYNGDPSTAVAIGGIYWSGPAHEIMPEGVLVKRTY